MKVGFSAENVVNFIMWGVCLFDHIFLYMARLESTLPLNFQKKLISPFRDTFKSLIRYNLLLWRFHSNTKIGNLFQKTKSN